MELSEAMDDGTRRRYRGASGQMAVMAELLNRGCNVAVCEGVSRYEQEYMGRGPKHIYAHLIGDLLVVRLKGS